MTSYAVHHKVLGGVAVYLLLASLAALAASSAAVPISTAAKDTQSDHRTAHKWTLGLGSCAIAGAGLAGIIGLRAWLSPTHTTTIADYRTGPNRHLPWYVAGFGALCAAISVFSAALLPSSVQGQKALVDQDWSAVATAESVLYVISLACFVLALGFVAAGGAHQMNAKRKAGKSLFVPMENQPDVVNIFHQTPPPAGPAMNMYSQVYGQPPPVYTPTNTW